MSDLVGNPEIGYLTPWLLYNTPSMTAISIVPMRCKIEMDAKAEHLPLMKDFEQ